MRPTSPGLGVGDVVGCPGPGENSGRANHQDQVALSHLTDGNDGGGPYGRTAKPTPTEGRSSVSAEQRETLEASAAQS
jgi:hypothetical protein